MGFLTDQIILVVIWIFLITRFPIISLIRNYLNHLGQDSIIIKGNQTFKFQQAKAQLYGWEANLDIHPYDWLHFENSISVTYALNKGGNGIHVTDSSKYLPFIPPLHTNTDLRANIKSKSKHFSSMYLKIGNGILCETGQGIFCR